MQKDSIEMARRHAEPIDAVITWVNGSSESHRSERQTHMAEARLPLHENAINPHRWACNNEILYCLQSIQNFAPWTRNIWIVVDRDTPDLSRLSDDLRAKVRFVLHREIFKEFSTLLPTFNSLAIESLIWRIDGLSECFMYFNDDVFLTAPLKPVDVFKGFSPVLRGKWVDYSDLLRCPDKRRDPSIFNHYMQLNAANLMGFDGNMLFSSAHVVHPLRRSVMAGLFVEHREAFVDNIGYRFRDLSQFLPQGLHNHACILAQDAEIHPTDDYRHIRSGQGLGPSLTETMSLLRSATNPKVKFLCVNDLPRLEQVISGAHEWLGQAIGGFPEPPCK